MLKNRFAKFGDAVETRIMNCRSALGGGYLSFPLKSSRPLPSRSARHPPPSGGGQEKDGCPLPSRSARHPPPKWGWARKTWRRGAINPKPCLPLLAGGGGPRSGGRGLLQAGIRTLSKERVPSNIKGQVNQITHLAGRQPAASCPIQLFQHIKHPLTGRAFHVFTACSEETPMQIESAFLRIFMHCCVMGLDMNESSLA